MKSLEELRSTDTGFSIGEAISDGWKLVSRHIGLYILGGIVAVLIGGVVGFIPFIGSLANNLIISPCFMASAIFITWHVSKGQPWQDFGEVFKGFSYMAPLMVCSLIETAVIVVFMLLLFFKLLPDIIELITLSQGQGAYQNSEQIQELVKSMFLNPTNVLLFFAFIVLALIISVMWAFKNHFVVIYNMDGWPAMEMSRKVSMRNFFPLVGLFIVLGIIIMISAIPCGIGLLFSLPLMIGSIYSAFAQITHCDQEEEVPLDFQGGKTV